MFDEAQTVEENFEPEKQFVVKDLETLKVISDSTRIRVGEMLADKPYTVKELAKALDLTPTKLYYHINLLEAHGLIRVVGTRIVSGIIEKQYRMVAYSIDLDPSLLSLGTDDSNAALDNMLRVIFDATREDVRDALKSGQMDMGEPNSDKRKGLAFRIGTKLTPEQARNFQERLLDVIKEFSTINDALKGNEPEDCRSYGLTVAFYPSVKRDAEPSPDD
jgi:DNA-binding transcriptional ArsR family regulator